MKPPYDLSPQILNLLINIAEQLGMVKAQLLEVPSPQLRKQNTIKTIHASLKIEGNTLTENQITALLENRRVIGPEKEILEVLNAIETYKKLTQFSPYSSTSFLAAHKMLMKGLVDRPGFYREKSVGIVKGSQVAHVAPPAANVAYLTNDLFRYLIEEPEHVLIKSCVFHYEMEFIHPFEDGNGRMGRLWQTLILMQAYPVFSYLPFESLISETQADYYEALQKSDDSGKSTPFIAYMLGVINRSLTQFLESPSGPRTPDERLKYFREKSNLPTFSRKDYLRIFSNLSAATASRDLQWGVAQNLLIRIGDKRVAIYQWIPSVP
jgi:Fic family protein